MQGDPALHPEEQRWGGLGEIERAEQVSEVAMKDVEDEGGLVVPIRIVVEVLDDAEDDADAQREEDQAETGAGVGVGDLGARGGFACAGGELRSGWRR